MNKLKPLCLNFSELLAQNIALISPTMTAALIVPLMFANSGNLSWLSYVVGTVMLLFVAFNLNQFAKRSSSSGSMYLYTSLGLGPSTGSLSGWCLIWAYLFIGLAGTTGFTIFAGKVLEAMGVSLPSVFLFALCIGGCFLLAYLDVVVSTIVMLVLEGISCALILYLCLIVLGKHGGVIDPVQFSAHDISLSTIGMGVVVAVFSLVGFESSTAFGDEARDPLQTIPKSIIWSLILTGLFFVFVCYCEVLGTQGYEKNLGQIDAPLNVLAGMYQVPFLMVPLSIGAMLSFFALALSCMNAGARVIFAMGKHGIFHPKTQTAHAVYKTPHFSLGVMAILMFVVVTFFRVITKVEVLDEFNDAGTMGAFGFLGAYALIVLAAPAYLKKIGQLKTKDTILCGAALVLLIVPAIGSVYPVPAAPVNYFPYVFLGYFALGVIRALLFKVRAPQKLEVIRQEISEFHLPVGFALEK